MNLEESEQQQSKYYFFFFIFFHFSTKTGIKYYVISSLMKFVTFNKIYCFWLITTNKIEEKNFFRFNEPKKYQHLISAETNRNELYLVLGKAFFYSSVVRIAILHKKKLQQIYKI